MSFGKDSSFVFCMQDGVLVNVGRGDVTADKQPLDSVEKEVWRIFKEHKELKHKIDIIKQSVLALSDMIWIIQNFSVGKLRKNTTDNNGAVSVL